MAVHFQEPLSSN